MSQRGGYKRVDGNVGVRLLVCRNSRSKNGRCKPEYSRGHGLTIEKVESTIQLEISARAEAIGVYVPDMKEINPEIVELRQSIKMLEAIDDPDLVEVIERKKTRLQLLIETEEIKTVRSEEKKELLEMVSHPSFWVGLSASERNAIYRDLVEVVWCDKGKLTVVLLV